jgi:hypothetical protein
VTVAELTPKTMGPEVIARRDGTCRRCHRPIEAGEDYVAKVEGPHGGWMHPQCAKSYCEAINDEVDQVEGERTETTTRVRQICRELRDLDTPESAVEPIERWADEQDRRAA